METVPTSNVGRSNLPSETVFVSAARELLPTPVVTRSSDVSRAKTTSTMVLGFQVRGGRSSAAIPEVETRPEMESRQGIESPAEIEIALPISREGDLGTSRPGIAEKLGENSIQ